MRCLGVLAVFAALLVAGASAQPAADPCFFEAGMIYSPGQVFDCFYTIPYSEAIKQNTLTSMAMIYDIYAFLDIATAPPESQLTIFPVDLMAAFQTMMNVTYATDYQFQIALSALFRGLYDAHTRYIIPNCYRNFTFAQPLSLYSYVIDGVQTITVSPVLPSEGEEGFYQSIIGYNLSDFAGATVVKINGEPAMQFMTDFATYSVGVSKDLGTRLNLALSSVEPSPTTLTEVPAEISGAFQIRTGDWSPFPDPSDMGVTYTLALLNNTEITVTIPWFVLATATITSTADFQSSYNRTEYSSIAEHKSAVRKIAAQKKGYVTEDLLKEIRRDHRSNRFLPSHFRKTNAAAVASAKATGTRCTGSIDCFELLVEATDVRFYSIVGDTRTVIMYLDTFEPANTTEFELTVAEGLAKAAYLGLDHLVIDLTQNGGGDICLGKRMLQYIMPDGVTHSFGPTDMPQSTLANTMAKLAIANNIVGDVWSPDEYTGDNGQAFTDASWLIGGPTHVRGGRSRGYSQLLHLSDEACSYDATVPTFTKNITQIMIVTRGLCGSTCAFFANHAALYDHVSTVVVGGFANVPQQYTSFPGLQVLDTPFVWDSVANYFNMTNGPTPTPDNSLVPPAVYTTMRYRMCVREMYPFNTSDTPTEYTFMEATYHLNNTLQTLLHPELSWLDVAALF